MEAEIEALRQEVSKRDEMIQTMKTKTKDFVAKLKADQAQELEQLKGHLAVQYQEKIDELVKRQEELSPGPELLQKLSLLEEECRKQEQMIVAKDRLLKSKDDQASALEAAIGQLKQELAARDMQMQELVKEKIAWLEEKHGLVEKCTELSSSHSSLVERVNSLVEYLEKERLKMQSADEHAGKLQGQINSLLREREELLFSMKQKEEASIIKIMELAGQLEQAQGKQGRDVYVDMPDAERQNAMIEELKSRLLAVEQELNTSYGKGEEVRSMLVDREGEIKALTLRTADIAEAMKNNNERVAAGTEEEEEWKGAAAKKVEEQMKKITALENDLANKKKENDELRVLLEKEGAECSSLNLRIVTILDEKEREEKECADIFSQSEAMQKKEKEPSKQLEEWGKMLKENQFAEQRKSEQSNHLVEQLQSKVYVLNEELRASKGIAEELRTVIDEKGEEVEKLSKCIATLERAQADSKVRILDLSNQLVEMQGRVSLYMNRAEDFNEMQRKKEVELAELREEKEQMQEQYERAKKYMKQSLIEETTSRAVQSRAEDEKRSLIEELTSKIRNLETELIHVREEGVELNSLNLRLVTLTEEKDGAEKRCDDLSTQLEDLSKQLEVKEKELVKEKEEKGLCLEKIEKARAGYLKLTAERKDLIQRIEEIEREFARVQGEKEKVEGEKESILMRYETIVKDMEEMQKEREKERDSSIGLGSDVIALRAELEAKSSVVTSLQSQGNALQYAMHGLEEDKKALENRVKEMTLHIEGTLQKSYEDKLTHLKQQLSTLQNTYSNTVQELSIVKDNSNAELMQVNSNLESLQRQYSITYREKNELKERADKLQEKLEQELVQNQERKKKVKAYLDKVNEEQQLLLQNRSALETQLHDMKAEKLLLEEKLSQLELTLQYNQDKFYRDLKDLKEDCDSKLQSLEGIIAEKENEVKELQLQVEIASKTSMEEVNETRQKIEESLKEMEAHKAKRLTARNEMINLAKALERAQEDGVELKNTLQYSISPIIYEQITLIENLVRNVEQVAYCLTSSPHSKKPSSPRHSSNNHSTHSALSSSSSAHSHTLLTPRTVRTHSQDLIDFSPAQINSNNSSNNSNNNNSSVLRNGHANGNNKAPVGLSAISEALQGVEGLRGELEREQMGLTLLSLSIQKLLDIVSPSPSSSSNIFLSLFGCCEGGGGQGGLLEFLASATATSSEGVVRVHRNVSGSYIVSEAVGGQGLGLGEGEGVSPLHGGETTIELGLGGRERVGGERQGRGAQRGSFYIMAGGQGRGRKGYSNLNQAQGSNSLFSIEDEDELQD